MDIKVIKGGLQESENKKAKELENKKRIYYKIFNYSHNPISVILFAVKYYSKFGIRLLDDIKKNSKDIGEYTDQLMMHMVFLDYLYKLMSGMTLKTFTNLFPIGKDYDGEKYGCKDYYQTIEFIDSLGLDFDKDIIGNQIFNVVLEYYNKDIINFEVFHLMLITRLEEASGQETSFDKFLRENGVRKIQKIDEGVYMEEGSQQIYRETKPNKVKRKDGNIIYVNF